ncbi:MAG: ABC transporter permease subunit [Myxococcales bacterium]|nr:ABC transporter permease subunit [Myxococcales bacterium]
MRHADRRGAPLVVGAYVALSLALPLALLAARALAEGASPTGATIGGELWLLASGRSLALAATVALLACAGAYPLARALPAPLLFALFLISPLARALGVLGLGLPPGALAVALAELAGALPLAALLVLLRLRALDPRWLEAAADLGAGPWTRWRTITLPLLRPTLASAALWSALVSVGDIATLELAGGGKLYALALLLREVAFSLEDPATLTILSAALLALTLPCARALLGAIDALAAPGQGHGGAGALPRPRAALRALAALAAAIAVLPALGLARLAFSTPKDMSLGTSIGAAIEASARTHPPLAALAAIAGFALALRRPRLGPRLGALLVLPLAIPPAVQGILALEVGRAIALPPGELLTLWGLAPASLALAYLAGRLTLAGLPLALDEAACDLGAGPVARLRRLWIPLLGRPAAGVALVLLALLLGAVSVPAFTSGPGGSTLAVALTILARGSGSGAVALVTLTLALAPLLLVPLAARLGGPRRRP